MDENAWLSCNSPYYMLEYLQPKPSARKLRLFACACCRIIWSDIDDEWSRRAVAAAELYADESISWHRLVLARLAAQRGFARTSGGTACAHLLVRNILSVVGQINGCCDAGRGTSKLQADLLRCIVGNPFHFIAIDPSWLTWERGVVPSIARAAYEERDLPSGYLDNARLGILADALEEAGCQEPYLLGHLRGPGPHVRGCCVIDALLQRG